MNGDSNYSSSNALRGLQCFGMFLAEAIALTPLVLGVGSDRPVSIQR
jgi:hypothetical protein